jgi:hypothetical protein
MLAATMTAKGANARKKVFIVVSLLSVPAKWGKAHGRRFV